MFAFYLRSHAASGDSFLDIGVIDNTRMSSVADIVNLPVLDNYHWTNCVTGIKFGDDSEHAWATESHEVFTDSGTSFVTLSKHYWTWFINYLESFLPSGLNGESNKFLNDCSEYGLLPTVSVLYGGYYFEILPSDYVINFVG